MGERERRERNRDSESKRESWICTVETDRYVDRKIDRQTDRQTENREGVIRESGGERETERQREK